MNAGEVLLLHARVDGHARGLESDVRRLEQELASSVAIDAAAARLETARAAHRTAALRLRELERGAEEHRARMRQRERELMSGRINNPTELTRMAAEVDHMKERLAVEEDAELLAMEETERLEASVREAEGALAAERARAEAAAPGLRERLERSRTEFAAADAERKALWDRLPDDYRAAAARIRAVPPVAEVAGNQCSACHVQLSSSAVQAVRRAELRTCDGCGRILVMG